MSEQLRSRMSHKLTRDRVKLEIRRARKPFVVLMLMAALAVAAASYLAGNLRSGLPWESRYEVNVAVDDAKGVIPGKQEVRISGVPVGIISSVTLVAGHPVLGLSIEPQYAPLYRDARMRLRPATPLDDLFLDVEQRGHRAAGVLRDGQTLEAEQTQTPVDIGRVLNVFGADTRPRLKELIDELGLGLGDHGAGLRAGLVALAPFLSAARALTGQLAQRQLETTRLVHNFRLLTEELGRRDDQLAELVRGGATSLSGVAAENTSLALTLHELPPALTQLQASFATLRSSEDQLDPALGSLQPVATALPSGLAALRRLSDDLLPAAAALRPSVQHLAPLVQRLQPVASDLDPAFRSLTPQAPRFDQITAQVVPCELALERFLFNTISVTKFGAGNIAFPRGELVAGASLLGGQINDPAQVAAPSCAPGGPAR